jgi:hypothetical protein
MPFCRRSENLFRHLTLIPLLAGLLLHAQTPATPASPSPEVVIQAGPTANGAVRGYVVDPDGALVPGATVTLTPDGGPARSMTTRSDGGFTFVNVPAGGYGLAATAKEFGAGSATGQLRAGQVLDLPPIALSAVTASVTVNVSPLTLKELAEQDVKAEEKQRVFGLVPNFFVTYKKNPVPLDGAQKMELALHGAYDPAAFIISGFTAGIEQAADSLHGYRQGAEGYGKRYGAAYANFASATLLRDGVFPALFHQDPRYHYKGTGTKTARVIYALESGVICYGDNNKRQFNYSGVLGNLSAGALTNLYYPAGSKNGASTTITTGLLSTLGVGVGHVAQEFLFSRITAREKKNGTYQP